MVTGEGESKKRARSESNDSAVKMETSEAPETPATEKKKKKKVFTLLI